MSEKERCIYCHAEVTASVPPPDDDEAWEALQAEHWPFCEWAETRAHTPEDRR